jgi:hypothetical protein
MPPKDIFGLVMFGSPQDFLTSRHLQMPETIHLHASQAFSDGHCPVSRYKEQGQHNLNPKKMGFNQNHISKIRK